MKKQLTQQIGIFAAGVVITLIIVAIFHSRPTPLPVDQEKVFAIVDGTKIYSTEVLPKIQSQLRQLKENENQLIRRKTDELIDLRLLEIEASKSKIPKEQLFENYLRQGSSPVLQKDPTPEEIKRYIETHQIHEKTLTPQVRAIMGQLIKSEKAREFHDKFNQELRAKSHIEYSLPSL